MLAGAYYGDRMVVCKLKVHAEEQHTCLLHVLIHDFVSADRQGLLLFITTLPATVLQSMQAAAVLLQ